MGPPASLLPFSQASHIPKTLNPNPPPPCHMTTASKEENNGLWNPHAVVSSLSTEVRDSRPSHSSHVISTEVVHAPKTVSTAHASLTCCHDPNFKAPRRMTGEKNLSSEDRDTHDCIVGPSFAKGNEQAEL
jgi:hypothetical protein